MKEKPKILWLKMTLIGLCTIAIMFGLSTGSVLAHEADSHPHAEGSKAIPSTVPPDDVCRQHLKGPCDTEHNRPEHGSLANIGAKLANPLGDVWALSTSFNMPAFYDGDVSAGDPQIGAAVAFQPILPIPIYGSGKSEWRMVTRPVIPIIASEPIPYEFDKFNHKSGLGDIQLPLLFNLPESIAGHWIMGAGPVTLLPTATETALGENQWAMGPAVVLGYKTKKMTLGVFPNYFWKLASSGQNSDRQPNVDKGSMLYFFNYMLGDAWQIGMNPTISYNNQANSSDKWSVPVGGYVGKTIKLGKLPINIKVGGEYSVVSPDTFGQRFQFRFQITPVIPSLIKKPIFGK